jgi:magnesium transporter
VSSPEEAARRALESARNAAADVFDELGLVGRAVLTGFGLDADERGRREAPRKPPGATPGIEGERGSDTPPAPGTISYACLDYGPDRMEAWDGDDLEGMLSRERPAWSRVRWLNVNGLHPYVVRRLKNHLGFHTLAAEDVLNTQHRPKLEDHADHLFIVLRMMTLASTGLRSEQISIFAYRDLLLTFQEEPGDVWGPIRERLHTPGSRLRAQGTGYLLYALLDAIVDHCFPILEGYGELLDELESEVLDEPEPAVQRRIHAVKRELLALRRNTWPLRELLSSLQRDEREFFDTFTRTYLRDVHDHALQVIDLVESYREMSASLNDLYTSAVGNRLNEVMRVLTLMASFFIPITFLAGVYGMNFKHIPELALPYGYACFWAACVFVVGGLAVFFRRKGWI